MKRQLLNSLDHITFARGKLNEVKDTTPAAEIRTAIMKLDEAFMWIEKYISNNED